MKVGTKSLLFGIHQVIWHPIVVLRAWIYLYGWPNFKELVCIVIHDWGYAGKPNLDGPEGENHPVFGAKLAGRVFGKEWFYFCLLHSRTMARKVGQEPSKLCWADKLSFCFEPRWFYLTRAKLSGEIKEIFFAGIQSGLIKEEMNLHQWHQLMYQDELFIPEIQAILTSSEFNKRHKLGGNI